jgi:hypothetical protein
VQELSAGFWGGHVIHANIVGRGEEGTNKGETKGETFDFVGFGDYDVIFPYLKFYSHA